MADQFIRTKLVFGKENVESLADKHVAVFGLGGVGGNCVEALARSGIGHFTLVDNDTVALSNLNRQIIATCDTIGQYKVDVMKQRILSINPEAEVITRKCFYLPETADGFDFTTYDYVIDAIDTVTAKIDIICKCYFNNVPVISSMGTGNKVNPCDLVVTDIYKTEMDPLAKVMRHELKKRSIKKCKVVYSKEKPLTPLSDLLEDYQEDAGNSKRVTPGSNAFVPSVAGIIIASEVVKDLMQFDAGNRQ